MFDSSFNAIISNQKEIFLFELNNSRELKYRMFNASLNLIKYYTFIEQGILKYCTFIDKNNIIHLVFLLISGDLIYYQYVEDQWKKNIIAKFDLKSHIYNQFQILMQDNKFHIIYNYSNVINSNVWTVQHIIYNTGDKFNAIRYISKKNPEPFIVDLDKQGTIHILYKSNLNNPQIYNSFYSDYTKSWNSNPKQMSTDNNVCSDPFLFIDSRDNLHSLWIEESSNKQILKYLKMNSSGKDKYIWKDVILPYKINKLYNPIIMERNNVLKLIFNDGNNLNSLISEDFGNTWTKADSIEVSNINELKLIKANSNIDKVNYVYFNENYDRKLYYLNLLTDDNANKSPTEIKKDNVNLVPLEQLNVQLKDVDHEPKLDLNLKLTEEDILVDAPVEVNLNFKENIVEKNNTIESHTENTVEEEVNVNLTLTNVEVLENLIPENELVLESIIEKKLDSILSDQEFSNFLLLESLLPSIEELSKKMETLEDIKNKLITLENNLSVKKPSFLKSIFKK